MKVSPELDVHIYLISLTGIFLRKKCESSVKEQAKVKLHLERWGG